MTLLELGPYIRQERKRAGLSMLALAKMAGVDRTTISKLENQHLPEMGYAKLERVLAILGLEFSVRPVDGLPTLKDLQRENARGRE
ncbi:helix-turn-helix domain-containing protein [Marinobacter sp. SS5-14b]|uniref:helix-turn-helix domain-containing protein n=1 Tax=Marinobacter sp. SS5-14b TaxID=3050456 RepID=UPI0026DEA591|nr:helix-turn-helix domain-containing protein [Marinobacter sp. SS5-14b]